NKKVYMWYWPGCEVEIHGLRPTYCDVYKGDLTMEDLEKALSASVTLLEAGEADIAAIYFEQTDAVGHSSGPFSPELNQVLSNLDPVMSDLADRLAKAELSSVNLIVVSDHGMAQISEKRTINLTEVLVPEDYVTILGYCTVTSIYTTAENENQVYRKLQNFHPHLHVYRRSKLPERWRYKLGKYVPLLTAVADTGWCILTAEQTEYPKSKDGRNYGGYHGYDNQDTDMYGVFLGMGSGENTIRIVPLSIAFKSNVTSDPIHVVDVYQVMCDILGITAAPNNGSATRKEGNVINKVLLLVIALHRDDSFVDLGDIGGYRKRLIEELHSRIQHLSLWTASVYRVGIPTCLQREPMTVQLRCAPVIHREVDAVLRMQGHLIYPYTSSTVPSPSDGPRVIRLRHQGQGHAGLWPLQCVKCGQEVAGVFRQLQVGTKGPLRHKYPPPLRYRDIFVLTSDVDLLAEDAKCEPSQGSGFIRGLRLSNVPVCVFGRKGEDIATKKKASSDVAVAKQDVVTVTNYDSVTGLERKLVVYLPGRMQGSIAEYIDRVCAMGRCTTQLVMVDLPQPEEMSSVRDLDLD
ncbi:hypothetical protein BaRGS_00018736, partial [Batillaria attramentaria]